MIPQVATLDFETKGIEARPVYPPKPVGCAIRLPGDRGSSYLAWGHPYENNIKEKDAKKILLDIIKNMPVLFHNASFDFSVGVEWLGWPVDTPWQNIHDTLFLAFLHDPRDRSLSLKPWADKYLGMPPDEQDELKAWILENVPGAHDHRGRKVKNPELFWGALISEAPGGLVGKYAKGDTDRTWEMFKYTWKRVIEEQGMLEGYNRERRNLRVFDGMSDEGIKVNRKLLGSDIKKYESRLSYLDKTICRKLGRTFDVGSGPQLADALDKADMMERWVLTPTGKRSTAKDNLIPNIRDQKLVNLLGERSTLVFYLSTFIKRWHEDSIGTDRIYPGFHQVRSTNEYGGGSSGARTGRPSSSNPNLLNVPKYKRVLEKPWGENLPNIRTYIQPDKGCVILNRDYAQQEVRILAHYENGLMQAIYKKNPNIDIHDYAVELIHKISDILLVRDYTKTVAFGIIYGMGAKLLASMMGVDLKMARTIIRAYKDAFPGIGDLIDEINGIIADGGFIKTWGGRVYYPEPGFEYKLLNVLIQGSAADCTKEAMQRCIENCSESRIMLQVYDEILMSAPIKAKKTEMIKMKDAMESIEFEVPMLSDGKWSAKSWGDMQDCGI